MLELANKVASITGAFRGIGKEIALVLARNGADVVLNYRQSDKEAADVAEKIVGIGRRAVLFKVAVSNYKETKDMEKAVREKLGSVHPREQCRDCT